MFYSIQYYFCSYYFAVAKTILFFFSVYEHFAMLEQVCQFLFEIQIRSVVRV